MLSKVLDTIANKKVGFAHTLSVHRWIMTHADRVASLVMSS